MLQKEYKKPNFSDVIGTVLYDKNIHKIDFFEKKTKFRKKHWNSWFFCLARSIYLDYTIYSKLC